MPFPYTFPLTFDTEDFQVRIAFSDSPFAANPTWTEVTSEVISIDTQRGRQRELDRMEAGTAIIVVDNTSGNWWPDNASGPYYDNLKPGKRINIQKTYGGTAYDVYTGFIEEFEHGFQTKGGKGPIVRIIASDLLANLALSTLNDVTAQFTAANSEYLSIADNAALSAGDIAFTVSAWVYLDTTTASRAFVAKTDGSTNIEYLLYYDQAIDRFMWRVSGNGAIGQLQQISSGAAPSTATWYHLVGYHDPTANTIGIIVNNGAARTQSHSYGIYDGTSPFWLGRAYEALGAATIYHDGRMGPTGVWKKLLTADEITQLYNSGRRVKHADLTSGLKTSLQAWWDLDEASGTRSDAESTNDLSDNNTVTSSSGYPSERADIRVGRVLDAIGWPSGKRDLNTAVVTLAAITLDETNALSHLQKVQQTEDGLLFIAGDGDVQFHDRDARSTAPFDTSQATFGDDAGEMPYQDLTTDYSNDYIYNDVRITREGGTVQVAGDADSQATYGKRSLELTELLFTSDADALTLAKAKLAKFKTPVLRVASILVEPEYDPANLWPKVLSYDISTRITVRLNEASIDAAFHIEEVAHAWTRGGTWQTQWQLSKAA